MRAQSYALLVASCLAISACGGGGSNSNTSTALVLTPYVSTQFKYLSTTENVALSRGTDTVLITPNGTEYSFGLRASDIDAFSPNGEYALSIGSSDVRVSHLGSIHSFPLPSAPVTIYDRIDNDGNVYGIEDRFSFNSGQQAVLFRTKNGTDKESSTLPNGFIHTARGLGQHLEIPTLFIASYQNVNHLIEFRPNQGAIDIGGLGSYFGGVYCGNSKLFADGTTFGTDTNRNGVPYLGRMGGPYRTFTYPTINGRQLYGEPSGFWNDGRMVFPDTTGGLLATETGEYERIYTKIEGLEYRYRIQTLKAGRGTTIVVEIFDVESQRSGTAILRQQ